MPILPIDIRWADIGGQGTDTDQCPRCQSEDLAIDPLDNLNLPQPQADDQAELLSLCQTLVDELNGFLLNQSISAAIGRCQQLIQQARN